MFHIAIPKVFEHELDQTIEYLQSKDPSVFSSFNSVIPDVEEEIFTEAFSKIVPPNFKICSYTSSHSFIFNRPLSDLLWELGIPHIYIDLSQNTLMDGIADLLIGVFYTNENTLESFELKGTTEVFSEEIKEVLKAFEHPKWVLPKTLNNFYLAYAFYKTKGILEIQERIALTVKAKLMVEGSVTLNSKIHIQNSNQYIKDRITITNLSSQKD